MNILKTVLVLALLLSLGVLVACVAIPLSIYTRIREGDFLTSVTKM